MKMATTVRRVVMDLNYNTMHHNCSHCVAMAGDFFFFWKTQSFFVFLYVLNVSATPKVIACCSPAASRCSAVFSLAVSKVNTQPCTSTLQHAGRSTQGPADTPSPRCAHWSLVRQRNLARSSPASSVYGARRASSHARGGSSPHARLAEPPLLLHHLADSLRRLDADSRGRRNVSLTFPPAGWMDG